MNWGKVSWEIGVTVTGSHRRSGFKYEWLLHIHLRLWSQNFRFLYISIASAQIAQALQVSSFRFSCHQKCISYNFSTQNSGKKLVGKKTPQLRSAQSFNCCAGNCRSRIKGVWVRRRSSFVLFPNISRIIVDFWSLIWWGFAAEDCSEGEAGGLGWGCVF